jgi:UDP-3-O-[3-hydroxymyristoyl] glucosamine N-acyltransferase
MLVQDLLEKSTTLTLNTTLSAAGALSFNFEKISDLSLAGPTDLVLISKKNQIEQAYNSPPQVIVYLNTLRNCLPQLSNNKVFIESSSFSQFLSDVLPFFLPPSPQFFEGPQSVHPTAKVGKNVTLSPFVVIGAEAEIGDNVFIGAHSVIGSRASIGARTRLSSHVHIGDRCRVGSDCLLHSHVCLGSDGFGFWTNPQGVHKKIPQIGDVVIENFVELGSFVGIDRATLGSTIIREGTKLDNFCHVAHNCDIGAHTLGAAGFMVAGSCRIGHHLTAGGGTHIGDHVEIPPRVTLAGRTGITGSIEAPGAYGGFPVQPIKDYLKTMNNLKQITAMRKSLKMVLDHLGLKESSKNAD